MVPCKEVDRIVAQTGDLPAMPVVAQKVMNLVEREETSPSDLVRVISADPALASRILKISNSALFSRMRAVSTLSHAILILGFAAIRSLVLTASMRTLFQGHGRSAEFGLKERLLWEHSLGSAFASRLIAERVGHHGGIEAAFLGGLLHDIGKLVLNMNLPERYLEVFQEAYNSRRPFIEVETEQLGFTHADVGALVLGKWNFADELVDIVANHHTPQAAIMDPYGAAIINLGDLLCHEAGIGARRGASVSACEAESARTLSLGPSDIDPLRRSLTDLFEAERGLFDG